MRESVLVLGTMTAAAVAAGAIFLVSSQAQAVPLATACGLKMALDRANTAEQAAYICRRGSHGRRCYVSRRDENVRYGRTNPYVPYPYNQPRSRSGDPPYNTFYWGGPMGEGQ